MPAKTLMIQGTGSDVGKSIITAGLCRWFYKKGGKVAPFKAQNMALNSYVTKDGGEMGRAQVYQAEACGIAPQVAMNPVLLKPCGDNMSQVIVMGKVVENRDAKQHFSQRPAYLKEVQSAFDSLSEQYEMIILEGAGSPAEINLRHCDFVNMPMAEMADAPVIIVGDIDRGGVFAWMKGTFDLLTSSEKDRVCGFIINKFRGDIDLLTPGVEQFEQMVGKPVLGVIPFDRDLFVDEEDAIPFKTNGSGSPTMDVAVIRLPRIANFTDLSPLVLQPGVQVRYVWHPSQMGNPDLIILPGTKNTLDDMQFLREQELDICIHEHHAKGAVVLGICGGFQMLGRTIRDPEQLESRAGTINGLDLFSFETHLQLPKVTRQVKTQTADNPIFKTGLTVEGYEIHMGITQFSGKPLALFTDATGVCNQEGTLIGTYLHGFLDNDAIRNELLKHISRKRNLPEPAQGFIYSEIREQQLDRLMNLIDRSLDMEAIEAIINRNPVTTTG